MKKYIMRVLKTDSLVYPSAEVLSNIGITRNQFSKICYGKRQLKASEAVGIAKWLDVPVEDVIHNYKSESKLQDEKASV